MEFRPCIDIHNGKVKQIIGGSLKDQGDFADENFVSEYNAAFYANYYKEYGIKGGHIILLNAKDSTFFEETKAQALKALATYPNGMQIGGGITDENAEEYINAKASHIIVTSYVFQKGKLYVDRLEKLVELVGKEHIVLDLSCKKIDGAYRIVSDRWQCVTDVVLNETTLDFLADYCDEFLIHAVDVEGKSNGIEEELVALLGRWGKIPMTYAGGVHNFDDLRRLRELGQGKIHVTIGSALDLFGGNMEFGQVMSFVNEKTL
ncbi:MAG: phosphoribosylformimino-5-aminoimidazole carboxamide ribotide isomerase [Lachnospiraceae bacterium]